MAPGRGENPLPDPPRGATFDPQGRGIDGGMMRAATTYVRWVDALNRVVGRLTMLLIFVMMGVLLYSSISRSAFNLPLIWVVEMSQFMLVAYFLLGGGYSMQQGAHVRMDLFYAKWAPKKRAFTDTITAFCLIFYLVVLLMGGLSSTGYALQYGQKNYSSWAPPLAPIKIIMCIGIALMLLQAVAFLVRDIARLRGIELPGRQDEEQAGGGAP
jgi:TRAP-type mannitol/chloroaromatic compound transport system permease small subunit